MNAKPKFKVVLYVPTYNDRDGISGWYGTAIGYTMTEGFAHRLADMNDRDGMDETMIRVVRIEDSRQVFRKFACDDSWLQAVAA